MKKILQILILILLILGCKHTKGQIRKNDSLEKEIIALKRENKIINDSLISLNISEKTEEIANKVYDERHKLEPIMNWTNFVITIIMAVISILALFFSARFFVMSKLEYKQKINKFKKEANEKASKEIDNFHKSLLQKLDKEVGKSEKEFSKKLIELRAAFYYEFGMKFLNENNIEPAIEFFNVLYKSKGYRYDDVCYHLSECNVKNGNTDDACKLLYEAKSNTKDKTKLFAIDKLIKKIKCDK